MTVARPSHTDLARAADVEQIVASAAETLGGSLPIHAGYRLFQEPLRAWDGTGSLWLWAIEGNSESEDGSVRGEVLLKIYPDTGAHDNTVKGTVVSVNGRAWDTSSPDAYWAGNIWTLRVEYADQLEELEVQVLRHGELAWRQLLDALSRLDSYGHERHTLTNLLEEYDGPPEELFKQIRQLG